MQKRVDIGPDDTVGSLYFNHLYPMGVDGILESVDLVDRGNAPRIVQDESKATYEGWCGSNDAEIDWSLDPGNVHNLIRGCDPQPGAWSTFNDEKVAFFGSSIADRGESGEEPGTVIDLGNQGVTIAVGGGSLTIKRVRIGRGPKTAASEFGFSVGDRFS